MKNNKSILVGILFVLTIVFTQLILKAAEVTDFSVQITVTVVLVGGILFAVGMIYSKDKVFGFKLNLIAAIFVLIVSVFISINFVLNQCFSQLEKTHRLLSIMMDLLSWGSFLAFIIFIVVAAFITLKKNQ